jgi:hypothetical protein
MSIGIGDKVRLRIAAYGKPGVVVEEANGKCRVRWDDLELSTKHTPDSLVLSGNECERSSK